MLRASSDSLTPGVSFGSYVVRELIGRGGMASVYRAEHLLLNKPVALKVMDRSLLATAGARQRFVLEGRAAAAIKHPNVVDITDVGVHDDVPFLVMELLTGEDLDAHLKRRGPVDEAAAIRLALPIISGLSAAHSSGVVHRDIKPSNIFLSQGPDDQIVPKVLDFGISKVTTEHSAELALTPNHQVMGTPRYLPPEALQGARELGPASDQYSLGVVLYECVTGCTPFSGDTLIALLNALSAGNFPPPRALAPGISVGLERAIMRALSPYPSERFATLRDMGRALLELAAERTQMVWGHSFKSPGEEATTSRSLRSVPPTELLERLDAPGLRRYRHLAFGAGFICIGALASALASGLVRPGGAPVGAGQQAVRQVPTVSVAALAAPPEVPVRPVSPPAADEQRAAAELAPERTRPARNPARRPTAGRLTRRTERPADRARSERSTEARQVESAATSRVERRPAPTPERAPPLADPVAQPARPPARAPAPVERPRRGANRSPLLD